MVFRSVFAHKSLSRSSSPTKLRSAEKPRFTPWTKGKCSPILSHRTFNSKSQNQLKAWSKTHHLWLHRMHESCATYATYAKLNAHDTGVWPPGPWHGKLQKVMNRRLVQGVFRLLGVIQLRLEMLPWERSQKIHLGKRKLIDSKVSWGPGDMWSFPGG